MDRYELVEGTSAKFWEAAVAGATLSVRFGRIGAAGQSKDKTYPDAAAAVRERDKLVREKVAKGYARVGGTVAAPSAPVAPRPVEAAPPTTATPPDDRMSDKASSEAAPGPATAAPAPAPPPEPAHAVFDGTPLPTRTRPGRRVGADEAWGALHACVSTLPEATGRAGLVARPPGADALDAWVAALVQAFTEPASGGYHPGTRHRGGCRAGLEAAMRWLVESAGALEAAALADRMRPPAAPRSRHDELSWADPLHLALRAALVHAPEHDYDAAIAFLGERIAAAPDWPAAAAFAFILADDRPGQHALQPFAVLQDAAAAGVDVAAGRRFLPLIVDADPAAVAPWRSKRSPYFYLVYTLLDAAELAATLIAVARAAGAPALPSLDWLMHYALKDERTTMARAMLATREPGAIGALAASLHEKPVAAGLDAAIAADPAATIAQCAAALAAGRPEPILRARVAEALDRHGAGTVTSWLRGSGTGAAGPRAARFVDRLAAERDGPLAARSDWPRVLADPPWRRRERARDDLVLDLAPRPSVFHYERPDVPEDYWRTRTARVLGRMDELPTFVDEAEAFVPQTQWLKPPPARSPPPRGDADALLAWLCERLEQIASSYWPPSPYLGLMYGLEKQPEPLALRLWSLTGVVVDRSHLSTWPWVVSAMLGRFGERAMPGLLALVDAEPVSLLPVVLTVDDARLAPRTARALAKLKKARAPALAWLRRHRETAITRLLPDAVGAPGADRDVAEHALRWLAADRTDGRAAIERVAAAYAAAGPHVPEALAQVLDRDPLGRVPAKVARPPAWLAPRTLARPRLATGGGALSDEAVLALCEMLSFVNPDAVYAGVPLVREACTRDSLAAFAWDLFCAWTAAGTPSKDGWALRALGWFGDDDSARDLTRLIRRWPGEAAHARAVTGLDVLVDIGSDVALMNLNGVAEKLKFKGLQERAREKIAQLAEARGLSPEELSDRLAPDLDLDVRGGLDLDFGPRTFRAGFDEALKPWVRDAGGTRLKDLPKPTKSDDPDRAAAATMRWGALKKDARAVASLQVARLEAMLATSRRVRPEVFGPFFAAHPLVRHLAQHLVWGTFPDADPRTAPSATFRVAEDLGFTDAADEAVAVDVSAAAQGLIGLVHPLHGPDGWLAPWGALFGDYEIAQPFPQLGRETYGLTVAEKAAVGIERFDGVVVASSRLRGMAARGWRLGAMQDHGDIHAIEHAFAYPDGGAGLAELNFEDGLHTGAPEFEGAEQTLRDLTLESRWRGHAPASGRSFGDLDPVTASELLRGPSLLAGTRLR